ncbi:hypothetical protein [Amycolatopsis panacis]|uniref:hypothetical protein n=1 Tax=Amycolatopsis panacis TaxID=2340917 RepID=UPI000E757C63|nr:hypothetical protein [Amycolatopsis panacis]
MKEWLLSALSVLLIGGYGYWHFRNYRKRRDSYVAEATAHGWTYRERDRNLLGRCHGDPFRNGRRARAWHVITGTDKGREFTSFEYSAVHGYTDNDSNERPERWFTQIFALRMPGRMHSLAVQPKGVLGKLAGGLGFSRNPVGDAAFDQRWSLDGAPDDLTPQVRSWLAARQRPFRLTAGELWIWSEGRMDVARIDPALKELHELADALAKRQPR